MTPPDDTCGKMARFMVKLMSKEKQPEAMPPLDAEPLKKTLDGMFSAHTSETAASSPPRLQAALLLGSPEFMKH